MRTPTGNANWPWSSAPAASTACWSCPRACGTATSSPRSTPDCRWSSPTGPAGDIVADTVLVDNLGGTVEAVAHLARHGHQRIAFLGDAPNIFTASERLRGFREGCAGPGVRFDEELVVMGPHDERSIREALRYTTEIRHDDQDEFVLVRIARSASTRVHGASVDTAILRTGTRVDVGPWTLSYFREEYADHGRPYGGRIGGELGHQLSPPSREAAAALGGRAVTSKQPVLVAGPFRVSWGDVSALR